MTDCSNIVVASKSGRQYRILDCGGDKNLFPYLFNIASDSLVLVVLMTHLELAGIRRQTYDALTILPIASFKNELQVLILQLHGTAYGAGTKIKDRNVDTLRRR